MHSIILRSARRVTSALLAASVFLPSSGFAASDVVISQIYGGGGNSGASLRNDFIELFNRGTAPVSVAGWSIQYASATGNTWQKTDLTGTLQPGQYFLIQQAAGTGGSVSLPTPDAAGSISMSSTAAKVALVNGTALLTCGNTTGGPCAGNASIVDFVGVGPTATYAEGSPTVAMSNTTSMLRGTNGCADTDSNSADFAAGAPNPRNSLSPLQVCSGSSNAPVVATCPASVNATLGTLATAAISASDADNLVIAADIVGTPTAGITVTGVTPASANGGSLSATLNVGAVAGTYPVQVRFVNDAVPEQAATCSISVVVTAPVSTVRIRDIQGAGHLSPRVGQAVAGVPGIVTAKRSNGFYMQDPLPDNDPATSEGVFVFTNTAPSAVSVGDAVLVAGTVQEFRPGGSAATNANLSITQISAPGIQVLSSGNALPDAQLVGIGGRIPPNVVIDDDSTGNVETSGTFDAAADGIDFWESLEGMRIQINNAVAVGPTSNFGEIPVIADNGANATLRSVRGGIMATQTDGNPERILIDDVLSAVPQASVGDQFPVVVGIVDYSFGMWKLLPTQAFSVVPAILQPEVTAVQSANQLAIAAYNVENLDPNDPADKFATIASQIVNNLKSPDIIGMTEVQDNNGAINDAVVDASLTLQTLINAISAAGGPTYAYRLINPVDDQDGGQPGGNIRVGFLFNPARVSFVDRAGGTATNAITVVNAGGMAQLSASPGRIDPNNPAFNASRKPLAGEFVFNGRTVIAVVNHFNSKGGDNALMGRYQPPFAPVKSSARSKRPSWRTSCN